MPDEPEDHKDPDPNDGCPAPPDRDGDGIPDTSTSARTQPEDKDGIDDADGCPEDDADNDGIPDAKDACPKEPGQPDPDPKKNGCPKFIELEGSVVRVLQQVHFATGSATILPDSFPMLQEIVDSVEGEPEHQEDDDRRAHRQPGAADNNKILSQRRARRQAWLVSHGDRGRSTEARATGKSDRSTTNDTDDGRQANRRVEFKITSEDNGEQPPPPTEDRAVEASSSPQKLAYFVRDRAIATARALRPPTRRRSGLSRRRRRCARSGRAC